jgi:5-methylcytosine-specific restriction endonuclease McrA
MNTKLNNLLQSNNSSIEEFEKALYDTLLISLFSIICKRLEDKDEYQQVLDDYRKAPRGIEYILTKQKVKRYTKATICDDEAKLIQQWLFAFYDKKSIRVNYPTSEKKRLLTMQTYKCAICGVDIDLSSSELDHIIPWELVGDELKNNLQMLCWDCNRNKSNRLDFLLSRVLTKNAIP